MENYITLIIALLEKLGVLAKDEAEKLVKELHGLTIPDNYLAATLLVEDIVKKLDIKTVPQKLAKLEKFDTKK